MYYCGIDIAKHSHSISIVDETSRIVKKGVKVNNNRQGFEEMAELLAPYKGEVKIGLEATGHYWLALYDYLSHQEYTLAVINPMQVKAFRKMDIRKRKTDRLDLVAIAEFIRFANPNETKIDLPVMLQIRELSRFRFRLVQQIGDCKRKIITVLDRVFPEYEKLFSDVFLASSRQLLQHAVTAEEFAELDLEELTIQLAKASRNRFGSEKAKEIHAFAKNSVGVSFLTNAIHIEMQCLLKQIELIDEQRQQVETEISYLMESISQYITTIPGIGLVTGAMILSEIGDVHRFPGSKQLVAYAGIDAAVVKTGQFVGNEMHMSKRGSHYLRNALWHASLGSILHNSEMKQYYEKKRAEGKPHGVAMGAVCNKMLRLIYTILKEERPYINP